METQLLLHGKKIEAEGKTWWSTHGDRMSKCHTSLALQQMPVYRRPAGRVLTQRPFLLFLQVRGRVASRADESGSHRHQSRRAQTAGNSLHQPPRHRPWGAKNGKRGRNPWCRQTRRLQHSGISAAAGVLRRAKPTAESRYTPADVTATFNFGCHLAPRPHHKGK